MPRGVQVAVLAIALAASLPGCGRASYHAGLREGDALEVGATLADVIARHGCPDAIQTVSSGTFTLEYRKIELEGFLPGRIFERRQSLAYLVRREKNGDGVRLISPGTFHESGSSVSGLGDATAALEAPALRSRPLASAVAAGAVLCAFLGGTLLGPRK